MKTTAGVCDLGFGSSIFVKGRQTVSPERLAWSTRRQQRRDWAVVTASDCGVARPPLSFTQRKQLKQLLQGTGVEVSGQEKHSVAWLGHSRQ